MKTIKPIVEPSQHLFSFWLIFFQHAVNTGMDITQETVLQWLDANHRSQKWLSEQCGVTDQAISNWLREKNPRKIPAQATITIRRLMEEDAAAAAGKPPHALVLEFADDDYSAIEDAALADRKTIREWARDTLLDAANMDVDAVAEAIKRPAENPLQQGYARESLNASMDAMSEADSAEYFSIFRPGFKNP